MRSKASFSLSLVSCFLVLPFVGSIAAQVDLVGELALPSGQGTYRWVAEKDGYAYALTTFGTVNVFDVCTVSADGPFRTFSTPLRQIDVGQTNGLLRFGDFLYAFGDGILVLDVSDPANPVTGVRVTGHGIKNLIRYGEYLLGTGRDSVSIYSITTPSTPALVASTTLGGRTGYGIAYAEGFVYVGELKTSSPAYHGLRVLSWLGGSSLTSVWERAEDDDVPMHFLVRGLYMLEMCGDGGMRLWSLAEPSRPTPISMDEQVSSRCVVQMGDTVVTNGRVFRWHGSVLEEFSTFDGGPTTDGAPFGAAGNARFLFLANSNRIMILATPPTLVFPQYASGQSGGVANRTRLILRNDAATPASGAIRFLDSNGAPSPLSIGGTTRSEVAYSIPAWGTFQLVTDGTGTLRFGPMEVRSDLVGDRQIRGTEIFELLGYSASVQAAPLSKTHALFASRTPAEKTGVAIYNPSLRTVSALEAELLDKTGVRVAGPKTFNVAARRQLSVFVDDVGLFQSYFSVGSGAFEGTLKLRVVDGGPVSVISLIQKSANGSLLVVPVESSVVGP